MNMKKSTISPERLAQINELKQSVDFLRNECITINHVIAQTTDTQHVEQLKQELQNKAILYLNTLNKYVDLIVNN